MVDNIPETNDKGGGGDDSHKRHHEENGESSSTEIKQDDEGSASAAQNTSAIPSSSTLPTPSSPNSANKRMKREWLAFRGTRHTRVGDDFQVAALPSPGGGEADGSEKKDEDGNDKQVSPEEGAAGETKE